MAKIRLVLVEDYNVLRDILRQRLVEDGEIEIVGETDDGEVAIEMARRLRPDVVVTDIAHSGPDGIEVARQIVQHDDRVKVLVNTGYADRVYVKRCLDAGARGYVLKDEVPALVDAIKAVAAGELVLSPSISKIVGSL
jgi:DNA-binding NarL/FixJ family response regulator